MKAKIVCYSVGARGKTWLASVTNPRNTKEFFAVGLGVTQIQAVQNLIVQVAS